MKNLILFIFLISNNLCLSQNIDDIRDIFFNKKINIENCDSIENNLEKIKIKCNTMYAYCGANYFMYCNFTKNVYDKFMYFKKGKDILEEALAKEPNNLEIKFLRYINQINTPWFLNYKQNIKEDYSFIISNIEMIKSEKLKNQIIATIKEYK
tara:strand:+ start:23 stop:481 length:459 start_codon:yes stop_codon:yes gene_type:complete